MKTIFKLFIFLIFSVSFTACKKEAGLGGNTTLICKPEHHAKAIYNQPGYPDSAFIKFNASDFPGDIPSAYDLIVVGEPGEDHVRIEGLKEGKYYIFMTGLDTSINERVKGGIPYELKQDNGEVTVIVLVTEVH